MADQKLQIIIDAQDRASEKLDNVRGKLENMQKTLKSIGVAATAMGGAVVGFVGLSVKAATEAQASWAKVSHQVDLAGLSNKETMESIIEFSDAQQKLTGTSGEFIGELVGKYLPSIGDLNEATRMTKTALDMEAAGYMDAEAAMKILSIAKVGDIEMLKRYLPALREVNQETLNSMSAAEKYELAMKMLSDTVGGTAEVMGQTLEGKLKVLKETFGDLQETIGEKIIPILLKLLEKIIPIIDKMMVWIDENPKLAEKIIMVVSAIGGLLVVLGPLLIMLPGIVTAFTLLTGPVGLVIAGITALSIGITAVIKNWDKLVNVFSKSKDFVINIVDKVKSIPEKAGKILGFENGGIVPGRIGQPTLALVHGGESIMPPGKSNGNIFNFDFSGSNVSDTEGLKKYIINAINRTSQLALLSGK